MYDKENSLRIQNRNILMNHYLVMKKEYKSRMDLKGADIEYYLKRISAINVRILKLIEIKIYD